MGYGYQTVDEPYREPWFNAIVRSTRNPRTDYGDIANGSGMHYWRNEFDSQWAGGSEMFFDAKAYVMFGVCISEWDDDEAAARDCVFHRVGVRIRSKDRNHGVFFATDRVAAKVGAGTGQVTIGENKFGETVTVFGPINGVKYWLWDVVRDGSNIQGTDSSLHPQSITVHDTDGARASGSPLASNGDYGVEDLSGHELGNFGAFIWVKHKIDGAASYTIGTDLTGLSGETDDIETPGVDDINFIGYPWARFTNDSGLDPADDLTLLRSNTATIEGGADNDRHFTDKAGVLAHSPWVHISSSDITSPPDLPWPNHGVMFTPLGGCVRGGSSGTVTITHDAP